MFGAGFNVEAYQRRLDELKLEIRESVERRLLDTVEASQGSIPELLCSEDLHHWEKDVSLRYGRFLAQRTLEQFQRAVANFSGIEFVDDKQKHREHSAAELMGVVSGLHAASAMIRGQVLIADPVGAEAMMRIYEEANVRPAAKGAAPGAAPRSTPDANN